MKKRLHSKINFKNYAINAFSDEPIDVSNCIQVGKEIKFPEYDINKKIQKKLIKELPFEFAKKKLSSSKKCDNNGESFSQKENKKEITYPSGIIKTITKNEKDEIINESIDYSNLKQNYIQNLKNNLNDELEILVNNSFLLYNRKPNIKKIVKKPISTKILAEKICLWKYYIKDLSKEEKAYLMRRFLFYLEKFTDNCYEQFLEINEIDKAYKLMSSKIAASKIKGKEKEITDKLINKFHFLDKIIGCDSEGNQIKKNKDDLDDLNLKTLLFTSCTLNQKEEFKGKGCGYSFLRELRDIANMLTNASIIFDSVFQECYKIFDIKSFDNVSKIEIYRILWNLYSNYFIDNVFVMMFLLQLKYMFGAYKQYDIIKFMNKLILVKFNIFDSVDKIKAEIVKIIGPAEEFDDYNNIKKMENIDDIVKYIQEDEDKKHKKHKKKKKKIINGINSIDADAIEDKKEENLDADYYNDIDDGLSIISEDDKVLEEFRNDIIAETEYNSGNKIVPVLSSEFLNKFYSE